MSFLHQDVIRLSRSPGIFRHTFSTQFVCAFTYIHNKQQNLLYLQLLI